MKILAIRILVLSLVIGAISILIIVISNNGKEMLKDMFSVANERLESQYSIPKEDSNLFSTETLNIINVDEIFNSKKRNPIGFYTVDSLYGLITHQIDSFYANSLKSVVDLQLKSVDRTVGVSYNVMGNSALKFQYKGGGVEAGKKLIVTMAGDSLAMIIANDSVLYYRVMFHDFSIKYSEAGSIDIFVEKKSSLFKQSLIPMQIMFLKRNKGVYLLVLHSFEVKDIIPPNYLINMLR